MLKLTPKLLVVNNNKKETKNKYNLLGFLSIFMSFNAIIFLSPNVITFSLWIIKCWTLISLWSLDDYNSFLTLEYISLTLQTQLEHNLIMAKKHQTFKIYGRR